LARCWFASAARSLQFVARSGSKRHTGRHRRPRAAEGR